MLPAEARRASRAALIAARALIVAAALLVAGCGDEDDDTTAGGGEGATELEVTLDADGPAGPEAERSESVSCEPGVGGSPCARLDATDLAPLDPMTPCTEIYGGPDEAAVTGTIAGEDVSATLTRANGCEIDRFDRLTPLLRDLFPGYEPGASLRP